MSNSKRTIKNIAFAVIQTLLSAAVLFYLYRYILKTLGAEQLGLWSIILATTSVGRISDLGFSGAALKFVARCLAYDEPEKASIIIQTSALTIAAVLSVIAIFAYPLMGWLLPFIVPEHAVVDALKLIPWAIASLWLGMVSSVFQSAIDGCKRLDLRNLIQIFGNVLYLVLTLNLVPILGLEGLAIAQAIQGVFLLVACWWVLRKVLKVLPIFPYRWEKTVFRETLSYAANFQIASLATLLFDPVTKFLLAKYGSLASTAYYEMANQVIIKARVLVLAGLQAFVPLIAGTKDEDLDSRKNTYKKTYELYFSITWPYYLGVMCTWPLISFMWLGHYEETFVVFGMILSAGWLLSNLGAPAYYFNIGTGLLRWNTISQLLAGILNLLSSLLLGKHFGGFGIVICALSSMFLANWVLAFSVQKRLELPFSYIFPAGQRAYGLVLTIGCAASLVTFEKWPSIDFSAAANPLYILPFIVAVGASFSLSPFKKMFLNKFESILKKGMH